MHTEETLLLLEAATKALSLQFSTFLSVTCAAYETRETAKEHRARLKHSANKKSVQTPSLQPNLPQPATTSESAGSLTAPDAEAPATSGEGDGRAAEEVAPDIENLPSSERQGSRLRKSFGVATYKYHALTNYAHTIRRFGTTDSYSTERVRLSL
jgi:hypothetical protein